MSKIITFFIIFAAIVGGLFFFATRSQAPAEKPTDNSNEPSQETVTNEARPWIEVAQNSVKIKTEDGWQDLHSGDEIPNGATISTDESGLASIHMPDGSSIQIDSSSEITLDQADYTESDDSLKVQVRLTMGKVWSKIVELATTESYWEVKTTNAVASVRGTAFGTDYSEEGTYIIGSENTVEAKAIDPETSETLDNTPITASNTIFIGKDVYKSLRDKKLRLASLLKMAGADTESRPWIKRAKIADQILNRRIEELKARGLSKAEIRLILRRDLTDRRRLLLIKLREAGITPRIVQPLERPDAIQTNNTVTPNLTAPSGNTPTTVSPTQNSSGGSGTATETPDLVTQNWLDVEESMSSSEMATGTANLGAYFLDQNNLVDVPAN